ncbi:DNA polymerase III subunit delta' [Aureimonas phyllosphaerae]|uniref:DNA polymerase-3 subunit delta n=1 Tax=Aureimonas phyllosphaerae TaxID=1166078 RepID=A0A7W6BUJ7_9HYPH|nr:DNA polymerase III subunit delta' [Aureimonas phyllosphaerae]MBB3938288.1 DNA polymerase-3 subunit delta' [Aureimonas phyllosphaerae]MBB3962295.1 DNA polymerase-3 subunit delta' [Aureimonas phyllosphaerae]SFF59532.1 DNA polymerase III, delta prime subunit [Aureimonas phyllosphaerae]
MDVRPSHDDIDGIPPPAATPFLAGHTREWQELVAASKSERMHHAWLLQGPRGVGKATLAFAFARHLVGVPWTSGEEQTVAFDAEDPIIRQIASGAHPNVIHIQRAEADRGGYKTQITVDEIRRLQGFFRSTATPGWRIAILDPADDLNRNAANALLKILEEPPARSIFLITNHAPGRILPTIRSRCRTLRIDGLDTQTLKTATQRLLPDIGGDDLAAVADLARGSLRQAVILRQGGGVDVLREADRILGSVDQDWQAVHALLDGLQQKGREVAFDLFRDRLCDRLAELAADAASKGRAREGAAIAGFCLSEQARFREAAAYNLDRKQAILSFLDRYRSLRAEAS